MLPKQQQHWFLFTTVFLSSLVSSYQQVCDHQDESSLLAFAGNLSASSTHLLNWSSSTNCCQWEGVHCDTNGSVTSLQLESRGLKGIISSSIGNLVSLTSLILFNNSLYGSLGEEITRLTNLRTMDLSSNMFFGPIPQEIGNLLFLEKLHLHTNNLTGPIPPSLMKCTSLLDIILMDNHLDGDISELDFSKLARLQKLDLLNNNFSGTLPESIYSCKSLTAIRVAENNLTGQISPKIAELESLSYFSISQNSFTNITRALKIFANCMNLTTLFLEVNFYGESLPSDSNFFGPNTFPKLEMFSLDGCSLSGLFPKWLSGIKTLRALNLNKNKFRGEIPNSIGTLPNLFYLSVHGNHLSGEIPPQLCQLPILTSENVDPKYNHLSIEFEFYTNSTSGRRQYTTLQSSLHFSNNNLSGHIPLEIGNLRNLQRLHLANNLLSGHIPVSLSGLKRLEALDLSSNNLTGGIPVSLTTLSFLSFLNVADNNLEGPIPSGTQFESFGFKSFKGNSLLCGEVVHRSCVNATSPQGKGERNHWFIHGFFVGCSSGFLVIIVLVASYVWLI